MAPSIEYAERVAQEVQAVFPEAVTAAPGGYLQFDMHPVKVALVNAVKELKTQNERLARDNEALRLRLERLEKQLGLAAPTAGR